MKCIICEQELLSTKESWFQKDSYEPKEEDNLYPDLGGQVKVSFGFGSKFDHIGHRSSIRGGPAHKISLNGKELEVQKTIDSEPRIETLSSENRAIQLASCKYIYGVICDNCFEKKADLFVGYEENVKTLRRRLV